jgi:transglutaminase-like putative cysteine protease
LYFFSGLFNLNQFFDQEKMNRLIKYILLFPVILFILLSCAGKGKWATQVQWADLDWELLPSQQDFPDEAAVVLLDDGKMEIFGSFTSSFSEFERHKIIKILNRRGEKFANVMIQYYPTVTIEKIEARTISSSGKIFVIEPKDIFDVNLYPNFIFYSDQRAKIFTFPVVEPGSILEYRYQLSIQGRTLWHSWLFQDEIPTLLSRFTVVYPSELELNYRIYNTDLEPQITEASDGFKATHSWEKRNIPSLKFELGMPPKKELLSRISLAPLGIKDWNEVAQWYDELSSPQMKANETVKKFSSEITSNQQTDSEKLQNIYEWVRDHVRFIAVDIDMGGFKPHPATEIFRNQYGDCKDMTTLVCSMAREIGIPVYPVLISTRQNGYPDTTLASPFQFNHAIAYCPAIGPQGVWMDATEKGCSFGQLPWYDQGMPVLVIGKDGKATVKMTPVDSSESNRLITEWKVHLDEKNSARIQGEMTFFGAPAAEKREELLSNSQKEVREWLESYLADRSTGATLDSFKISGLQPVTDPLKISYYFYTPLFARQRSGQLILETGTAVQFELPNYFTSGEREYPIQFRFPFVYEVDILIYLSGNYLPEIPVFKDSVVSSFGSANWSWQLEGQQLRIKFDHRLTQTDIPADQYSAFRDFLRQVQEKNRKEIILRPQNAYN